MKNALCFIKRNSKTAVMSMMISMLAVISAVGVSATDGTNADVQTAFSNGLTTLQSELMGYLVLLIPVALGIFATVVGIKKAMGWVKSLLGKA